MKYKIDLHTHSIGSPDGGLQLRDFRYFLENNLLDYIAITDHNSLDTALHIKRQLGELGKRIIVGEEIMTTQGEIIGLYLQSYIQPQQSLLDTVRAIHEQEGIVYVPHPFETVRSGLEASALNQITDHVDVIEINNGRAIFQNRSRTALLWSKQNAVVGASSSDSHGRFGWGHTYSVITEKPTNKNLVPLLKNAYYGTRKVGWGVLYPKLNRLRKGILDDNL